MVSIASTEYIHSSERGETGWLGLLARLPTVTPGSQGNLFIFRARCRRTPLTQIQRSLHQINHKVKELQSIQREIFSAKDGKTDGFGALQPQRGGPWKESNSLGIM
ncbi:hypothetical protein FQA47_012973 [Oryzias melastigma]|uniref:Uncharacterized protein n=1 Tax=Oryzias melastigma TaxID=30732 RepID=A0A834FBH3_ORYME|nr:hypothetical protein FQA47_012973 [Oryzias melastigma]